MKGTIPAFEPEGNVGPRHPVEGSDDHGRGAESSTPVPGGGGFSLKTRAHYPQVTQMPGEMKGTSPGVQNPPGCLGLPKDNPLNICEICGINASFPDQREFISSSIASASMGMSAMRSTFPLPRTSTSFSKRTAKPSFRR